MTDALHPMIAEFLRGIISPEQLLAQSDPLTILKAIQQTTQSRQTTSYPDEQQALYFKSLWDELPSPIAVLDDQMCYRFVNPKWHQDYGLSDDEIIGRSHYDIFPEIPDRWRKMHQRALAGETLFADSDPFVRKDGFLDYIKWKITPWRNQEGHICGIIMFTEVVTEQVDNERKRTEAEFILRRSEATYRQMFEGNQTIQILIDPENGAIMDANPAAAEFYGYSRDQLKAMKISQINQLPPHLLNNEMQRARLRLQTIFNFQHKLASGEVREVEVRSSPVHIDGKRLLYSTVMDVTQREAALSEAQKHQDRLRAIYETAQDGIFVMHPDGRFVDANPGGCRMTGYTEAEFLQGNISLLFFDEDKALSKNKHLWGMWKKGGTIPKVRLCHKDGTELWVSISVTPFVANGNPYVLGVMHDLSELHQTEKVLRQSEERYRILVRTMAEGIVLQNRDGEIIASNERAEDILGMTRDQMTGRASLDPQLQAIHEDGSHFYGETHPATLALTTGESQRNVIMGVRKSDGTLSWISINAEPLFHPDETVPYAVVSSFNDITRRKLAEEQQQQAEKLQAELDQARELNRLKSQLISVVAHEFRTPLAAIITTSEILQRYQERFTEPERNQRLTRIQNVAQSLSKLLDDMIYTSKSDMGEISIEYETTDLFVYCLDIVNDIQLAFQEADKIIYRFDGIRELPIERKLMHKILMNLLSNGIKYSFAKGKVYLTVIVKEDTLTLIIRDEGIGIPEEDQPQLFQIFQRASNVGTIAGTGLGLAIVKETIDLLNGTISFTSLVNIGTEFTVVLPIITTAPKIPSL